MSADGHIVNQCVIPCEAGDEIIVGQYKERDTAPIRLVLYSDGNRLGEAYMKRSEAFALATALQDAATEDGAA